MPVKILKAGVRRLVHVHAKGLVNNLSTGGRDPLVMIRPARNPSKVSVYRECRILGESWLGENYENPIPGTDGRGICYVVTDAAIQVWTDAKTQGPPQQKRKGRAVRLGPVMMRSR